jgi:poly-gamma-glutamate system protein
MNRRGNQLYWRPSRIPGSALFLLSIAAVAALLIVESFTYRGTSAQFEKMLAASRLMDESITLLRPIRGRLQPINPELDPTRSGLIGVSSSTITSNSGDLESKQATTNPNWAAVAVRLLSEAGVESGDTVGVAVSGSFPALNMAVYSALEAMEVRAITVVSGSASQWGANLPELGWLDMARELRSANLIDIRADLATLGGIEDRGVGMDEAGRAAIERSAERAGVELFVPDSYEAAVTERIRVYRERAEDRPIAAFVNVGGGSATTGPNSIDHFFGNGLIRSASSRAFRVPSVMGYFLEEEVPVINFTGIRELATRYGLPYPLTQAVGIGNGEVFRAESYRRWLAGLMIIVLLAMTALIMRSANIALAASSSGQSGASLKPKV